MYLPSAFALVDMTTSMDFKTKGTIVKGNRHAKTVCTLHRIREMSIRSDQ